MILKFVLLVKKSFLKTIRGDCHTAVGAYAEIKSDKLKLIAKLFSDDEKRYFYSEASGGVNEYNTIGKKVGLELLEKSDSYKKRNHEYNYYSSTY